MTLPRINVAARQRQVGRVSDGYPSASRSSCRKQVRLPGGSQRKTYPSSARSRIRAESPVVVGRGDDRAGSQAALELVEAAIRTRAREPVSPCRQRSRDRSWSGRLQRDAQPAWSKSRFPGRSR